jgi:hypothetical protein
MIITAALLENLIGSVNTDDSMKRGVELFC